MNTASPPMYEWNTLPWKTIEKEVFKLQKRIYQAAHRGEVKTVHKLQRLLTKSWYACLLAVRRVTQDNQGKKTAGIDGVKSLTPVLCMDRSSTLPETYVLGKTTTPEQRLEMDCQQILAH